MLALIRDIKSGAIDPWQLITNAYANMAELCGEVTRVVPNGRVRSRDRLFRELDTKLRWPLEAEEVSLYEVLEDHGLTSSEVASRAVSPARRFLPASRNSLDQR